VLHRFGALEEHEVETAALRAAVAIVTAHRRERPATVPAEQRMRSKGAKRRRTRRAQARAVSGQKAQAATDGASGTCARCAGSRRAVRGRQRGNADTTDIGHRSIPVSRYRSIAVSQYQCLGVPKHCYRS
jgi:hypothetical protein